MRNTLTDLLINHFEKYEWSKNIFFTKEDDEYIPFNSSQLAGQIISVIEFLKDLNLKEGDKVAIISENRVEWAVADFACMFLKLVSIPVYTSLSNLQTKYILENSGSKVCFVSSPTLLAKVSDIREELILLKKVVVFGNYDLKKYSDDFALMYSDIINKYSGHSNEELLLKLKKLSSGISGEDVLTIIYTSGTTGVPKGVVLTHGNIYSNIIACQKVLTIYEDDTFLSYLPYSHAYERTAGYYLAIFSGAKIYYAQSIETIAKQLTETSPTIVITVPRLLDKIYNKLIKNGEEMEDGIKKKIFLWSVKVAKDRNVKTNSLKWKIADRLVYKKIRQKTGNKVRFFVSGGGALNKSTGEFFDKIGITILEGYGMTETSPVISVNDPVKNKYGTVGKPLNGVSIKLSEENEILIRGELIMTGYYKDEEATKETIVDGWLHSGDIGEFDPEGYLKITDRKKSLMKTSGGKYVSPVQIEEILMNLSYIENVMVIGNERMYITALIVPDKNELFAYAVKNKINYSTYQELIKDNALLKLIQKDIEALQTDLSGFERVRRFTLLANPMSIETGELTPTLKIKRKTIEEKYKNEIENMYLRI
ncbi:MAG: long-chain fatty acid--CoA ligase [Bacteroidota bacterium]|nr:long-chain fatty acid--CoA ligase [Bacteroidota bacterium]